MSTATFVGVDSTIRGDWVGVYGSDGYLMWGNNGTPTYSNLPSYIDSIEDDGVTWYPTENPGSEPRYLQLPDASGRSSFTVYQEDAPPRSDILNIDLTANDEDQPYFISIYAFMVVSGRFQDITIMTPDGLTVLATSDNLDYEYGVYWRFLVTGSVKIVVKNGYHPVVCGYFFDSVSGPTPSPIGHFVGFRKNRNGLIL